MYVTNDRFLDRNILGIVVLDINAEIIKKKFKFPIAYSKSEGTFCKTYVSLELPYII